MNHAKKSRFGRRRAAHVAGVALATGALLTATVAAYADTLFTDGDTASPGGSPSVFSTTDGNCGDAITGALTLSYNGNQHFDAGEPVTITFYVPSGSGLDVHRTDAKAIPSSWGGGDSESFAFSTSLSGTADGNYKVGVSVVGDNSGYGVGKDEGSGRPQFNVSVACGPTDVGSGTPAVTPSVAGAVHNAADDTVGTTFPLGTSVYDTATLSATNGSPTGDVTFDLFSGTTCGETDATKAITTSETKTLASGVARSSASGALHAGSYHYEVTYASGDVALWNNVSSPHCDSFTINQATPSVTSAMHFGATDGTTPSLVPVDGSGVSQATMGAVIHDSAAVSGITGFAPSGTVTFTWFPNATCATGTGTAAGSAGINSGVADPSTAQGPLGVGAYSFQPSYGGDSDYVATPGACEPLTVSSAIGQFYYTLEHDTYAAPDAYQYTCTTLMTPCATSGGGKTEKVVPTNSTHTYTLHVVATNNSGGTVTEKVQGGLLGYKGATFTPIAGSGGSGHGLNGTPDASCGKFKITVSKNQIVVVWNAAGDGNTSGAGFTMANGASCEITIDIANVKFGASGDQPLTGSWSTTQSGPGTYSAKSPYTGNLLVKNS